MGVELRFCLVVAFLIVTMKKTCVGEQRFLETPPYYQEVLSGEDTTLRCKIVDKVGQCIWRKDFQFVDMYSTKYKWAETNDTGDCTVVIERASVDNDDGFWECLVTPGGIRPGETRNDILTSLTSRLIVLVQPVKPKLEYNGTDLSGTLTLREDQEVTISCISRFGNPPAILKWYIGEEEIEPLRDQINGTEVDNPNVWSVRSHLKIRGRREMHRLAIKCLSLHPANPSLPSIAESQLEIHYGPRPITKTSSPNTTVEQYKMTVWLGSSLEDCICNEFEANPSPYYRWLHYRGDIPKKIENPLSDKLSGRRLMIKNASWSDEGEYRCFAYNVIKGVRREIPSDVRFLLNVLGPPEIQPRPSSPADKVFYGTIGWIGEPVHRLKSRFCSGPSPRLVEWQWGEFHIREGERLNTKYKALPLEPIEENEFVTNCYWAMLEIRDLQTEDAGIYRLLIENEKGRDSTNLKLNVYDPMEIFLITVAAVAGLLLFLFPVTVDIYLMLRVKNLRYRKEVEAKKEKSVTFFHCQHP